MTRKIRCAIYTRKSTEDGLDQEFNSLDAQHEACAAYIASQRGEGWSMLPARYDDGGVSGGTLERPALTQLMEDVDAGRIDMIVVYKIDRLTRSLSDFAKLVDRFEAAGCSFVSVTQAFNTSSSMGRLTLNMLLSFAQFEREVTAERIRDKIAASKKRGLWMGGVPPLGYNAHPDPNTRSLVINEGERGTVETLYDLYDELGCLRAVEQEADRRGLRSKRHVFSTGRVQGGGSLSRGQIHHILCNPIYVGRIRHKDKVFDGQHAAIIVDELWDRVQAKLQDASVRPRSRSKAQGSATRSAPLTGKFRDQTGDRLTPSHASKGGRRIRYYVSNRLLSGGDKANGWRLPAQQFENSVATTVAKHLEDAMRRHTLLAAPDLEAADETSRKVDDLVQRFRSGDAQLLKTLVTEGQLGKDRLKIQLDRDEIAALLEMAPEDISEAILSIEAPFTMRRRGVEARIVTGEILSGPDRTLIRGLAKGHKWAADLQKGMPISQIARREKVTEAYIRTRAQLAFLAPSIQTAIFDGKQPANLTLEKLVRMQIPLDWTEQERLLGIGA
ncbi:recombinase family protein [Roseovarius indicus]|uniref:DNA-invertase hin n=1 Tax=Roseovarius indicus TaxID=540747 RepID=A0A0T5PDQ4_9RHOB|nr:recombinase family protein [Roseovarius indicus]KRS19178.1 resolvase [Roseovarius indicus]QEW25862.1 DNA-invertase hin [Roseovarius indicus]SFD89479.1 Site-specific DNA recombinase [Roseovarius indicus]